MKRTLAVAAVALALAAAAHAEGLDVIQVRQSGQDLLLSDFAGIRAVVMLKGDVKTLQKPALAMARWMKVFPDLFPPGSDKGDNTKALPAIWTNNAGFRKDAANFVEAADALAEAAKSDDTAAMGQRIKAVGDACGACHHEFRAK
ncbi:MAG TPA: cytochrome c [Acetobacteraceae bacterium]|nr:cytochrome c [Acetobacteraceae bacterium]